MEIKNKLTEPERRGEEYNGAKNGKDHQGTCIKDTWTRTMGRGGLNAGGGGMWGGRVVGRKWGQL